MAQDNFSTKPSKSSRPGGSPDANTYPVPLLAIVKDNVDPTRSGRIRVYLSIKGDRDANDQSNWITVSRMLPFYGITTSFGSGAEDEIDGDSFGSYVGNPASYGMWTAPPDIGTTVLVVFVNGDINYGFYLGAIPTPEALQMVPAIGAVEDVKLNSSEQQSFGGAPRLPVTNINLNNESLRDGPNYLNATKPLNSYQASIFHQQGLIRDPIRGPIGSSAARESASKVGFGVSTPGRAIYNGGFDDTSITGQLDPETANPDDLRVIGRRAGHTFVMDDGDVIGRDQLIRLRTSLGHQILMSDDGQVLQIMHSNGQAYVELGKEGTVDIYTTNSFNVRSQGDINFHADRNINLHAKENISMYSNIIHSVTEDDFKVRAGKNIRMASLKDTSILATADISLNASGEGSLVAGGQAFVNGSKVNLNSGGPSARPESVDIIPQQTHPDTLLQGSQGFVSAPGQLVSITSRAPAHAPWAMAGQGVDVKIDLSAGGATATSSTPNGDNIFSENGITLPGNLPSAPSADVAGIVNDAITQPGLLIPDESTLAQIPQVEQINSVLNQNSTNALLGAAAAETLKEWNDSGLAQTPLFGVNPLSQQIGLGPYGLTPDQLERSGIIKPGSATRINALVSNAPPDPLINIVDNDIDVINQYFPDEVFTGKNGIGNFNSLISSVDTQSSSVVDSYRGSLYELNNAGVLSGTESPIQQAGLVLSGARHGIQPTIDAVTGSSSNVTTGSAVLRTIGTGSGAAGVALGTGGLGAIQQAVNVGAGIDQSSQQAINATLGPQGAAYRSITNNIPQFTQPVVSLNNSTQNPGGQYLGTNLGDAATAVSSAALGALSATNASGVEYLSGGLNSIASVVNNATNFPTNTGLGGQLLTNRTVGAVLQNTDVLGGLNDFMTNAGAGVRNGSISSAQFAAQLGSQFPNFGQNYLADVNNLFNQAPDAGEAALAGVLSAVSSLTQGGPQPFRSPVVAFNTVARQGLDAIVSSLLPGQVPAPNLLGEIPTAAVNALENTLQQNITESLNAQSNLETAITNADAAREAYILALQEADPGEETPRVRQLRLAYEQSLEQQTAAVNALPGPPPSDGNPSEG